jgi:hypothetical protein
MSRKPMLTLGVIAIFFMTNFPASTQTLRDIQKAAIQLTIPELVLATSSQLSDRAGWVKDVSWAADLNDKSWSVKMNGYSDKGQFDIAMAGFLWGNEAGDWVVNYSGSGQMASEPIQISGKMEWPYNKERSDRLGANFSQVTKFGEHSTWAWIVGSEVIVGGVIGGGAGIAVSAAAPPLTILVGLGGALTGANAAINLSNTIRSVTESDQPTTPPQPALPIPPTPGKNEDLTPKDGMLYAAITKEGNVLGSGPDPKYTLVGTNKDTSMFGQVVMK